MPMREEYALDLIKIGSLIQTPGRNSAVRGLTNTYQPQVMSRQVSIRPAFTLPAFFRTVIMA